jgi:hypothetical protein
LIVNYPLHRSLQAKIGAVSREAAVISEALAVVAEAYLVIGLVEAAVARRQLGLAIALESGTRDHVKYAVRAVAVFGRVAAALHFDIVDILRVKLWANIRRDAGIRHWNAVEQPRHLMSTANMKLVVDHVSARNIVGDHRHTVGLGCAGSFRDLLARNHAGG